MSGRCRTRVSCYVRQMNFVTRMLIINQTKILMFIFIIGHVDVSLPSFFLENHCSLDNMRYILCCFFPTETTKLSFFKGNQNKGFQSLRGVNIDNPLPPLLSFDGTLPVYGSHIRLPVCFLGPVIVDV